MDSLTRQEVIATFQNCTGMESVDDVNMWLDAYDWDLSIALRNAMMSEADEEIDEDDNSTQKNVSVSFNICFVDQVFDFQVSEQTTVENLKRVVLSTTGVPLVEQRLTGWASKPNSDSDTMKSLNLPKDNVLYLTYESRVKEPSKEELPKMIYKFDICDQVRKCKFYLQQTGSQSILQLKKEAEAITKIPIDCQLWYGFPAGIEDHMPIMDAQLTLPVHELKLYSKNVST